MLWQDRRLKIVLTLLSFERDDGAVALGDLLRDCEIDETCLQVNEKASSRLFDLPLGERWLATVDVLDYPSTWALALAAPAWGGMEDFLPEPVRDLVDVEKLPNLRTINCVVSPQAVSATVLSHGTLTHFTVATQELAGSEHVSRFSECGYVAVASGEVVTCFARSRPKALEPLVQQVSNQIPMEDYSLPAGGLRLKLLLAESDEDGGVVGIVAFSGSRPDEEPEILTHPARVGFSRMYDELYDPVRAAPVFGATCEKASYRFLEPAEASLSNASQILASRIAEFHQQLRLTRRLPDSFV